MKREYGIYNTLNNLGEHSAFRVKSQIYARKIADETPVDEKDNHGHGNSYFKTCGSLQLSEQQYQVTDL